MKWSHRGWQIRLLKGVKIQQGHWQMESESPLRCWSRTHTWNILHILKGCAFCCCLLGWIFTTRFHRLTLTLQQCFPHCHASGSWAPTYPLPNLLTNGTKWLCGLGICINDSTLGAGNGDVGVWMRNARMYLSIWSPAGSTVWGCSGSCRKWNGVGVGWRDGIWGFIDSPPLLFSHCFLCGVKMWSLSLPLKPAATTFPQH